MKTFLLQKFLHYRPASYKTLGTNFVYISFFRGLSIIFGMVTTYFLARSLSKEEFGSYQFILNIVGLCWIFALPGMQNAIMQNTSRSDSLAYRKASRLAFISSLVGSVVLLACTLFYMLAGQRLLWEGFLICALLFPFFKGLQHWRGLPLGREDIRGLYLREGIMSLASSVMIAATCLLFPGSLLAPLSALLLVPSLQNIIISAMESRKLPKEESTEHEYIRYGYKTSFHLAAAIISQHLDKILVFTFLSPAALAIFVAASRFADIARDAMQDIAIVITPRLARTNTYTKRLNTIFKFTAIIYGLFLTAFAFTLLPWLITTIFGQQYHDAVPYAQALLLSNAIGNFSALQFRYIRSQLDEQAHKETSLYLALSQIVFSLALIPTLGLIGVVIASFCNKFALMVYIGRIVKKRRDLDV